MCTCRAVAARWRVALLLLLALLNACAATPTAPVQRLCQHGSEFTWQPILGAAGDTIAWFGVCAYET